MAVKVLLAFLFFFSIQLSDSPALHELHITLAICFPVKRRGKFQRRRSEVNGSAPQTILIRPADLEGKHSCCHPSVHVCHNSECRGAAHHQSTTSAAPVSPRLESSGKASFKDSQPASSIVENTQICRQSLQSLFLWEGRVCCGPLAYGILLRWQHMKDSNQPGHSLQSY